MIVCLSLVGAPRGDGDSAILCRLRSLALLLGRIPLSVAAAAVHYVGKGAWLWGGCIPRRGGTGVAKFWTTRYPVSIDPPDSSPMKEGCCQLFVLWCRGCTFCYCRPPLLLLLLVLVLPAARSVSSLESSVCNAKGFEHLLSRCCNCCFLCTFGLLKWYRDVGQRLTSSGIDRGQCCSQP